METLLEREIKTTSHLDDHLRLALLKNVMDIGEKLTLKKISESFEKINVTSEDHLNELIKNDCYRTNRYTMKETNRFNEVITSNPRFFLHEGEIAKYKKGSSSKGYYFNFKDNTLISALVYKNDPKFSKILYQWKLLSKFKKLKFHESLVGNYFHKSIQNIPSSFATWLTDVEGKSFNTNLLKTLYDYKVTTGTMYDGTVIGEKKLNKIFGTRNMEKLKECMDNRVPYITSARADYDYSIAYEKKSDGTFALYLSEEYKGTGNGHYYCGTDWNNFIYCDKD